VGAKISLGMIVRNEGRTLRECLESVAPFVDEIVIGLGGVSDDDTEAIAREFTDKIIPIEWNNNFSDARNIVLDAVTGDYFLWLDGDDTIVGGHLLRSYIERFPNVGAFYMGYDYGRDEHDQTVCYLIRERLVALYEGQPNRGWRWIQPVHEVLDSTVPVDIMKVDDIVVVHHKPPDKHSPMRNLEILYEQLAESEPNPDPRVLIYIGNELSIRGSQHEAIQYWKRFLKFSQWDQERYQTLHKIAAVYRVLGDTDRAIEYDLKAMEVLPSWPDAYFGLAETYYLLKNYAAVIEWTRIGSEKEVPQTGLIINPLDYSYKPAVILGLAHTALSDYDLAIKMFEQAYEVKPEETIKAQILVLKNELNLGSVVKSFLRLREHLGRTDQWMKVRQLFDALPKEIQEHPDIVDAWKRTEFQTAHINDPQIMVDFYRENPHWAPMPDKMIRDPRWLNYPRLAFARAVARRIKAESIIDWGCSDGFISLPLAEQGLLVHGVDLDPRCVDLANHRAEEWGLTARFSVGDVDHPPAMPMKADLAIAFELIEHVVSPSATLDQLEKSANHIAITTPYMAWEHGNINDWDKLEPKGHLRIFDHNDLEVLMTGRGQIWNIYKQPYGGSAWLFADYAPGVNLKSTVTIAAPGTVEEWNPRKYRAEGLGGSETAIVLLTEALARMQHRPIVYGSIDEPGYYNGVCYRPTELFRPEVKSDVFIAWRTPEVADLEVQATSKILWLHDVDAGDRLSEKRAAWFDHIVTLTEWHRSHVLERYPFLAPEKVIVIGNGVDVARFSAKPERNPMKVIYSSSPDRGLDIILEKIWPPVVEQVPDAELHIYYGWNNFEKFEDAYPQLKPFREKVQKLLLNSKGVIQHGRVPQDRLAREMLEASVWLYPTYFSETYCITAVEAQLAGAIPITNHLAALKETVSSGIIIDGDVHDPAVQEQYVRSVVDTLQTPLEDREKLHEQVMDNAPAHGWPEVAAQWEGIFSNGKRPL
jgi:glycosyltransferase involved in cell wall biosynthesis